jgi:signal recognition particle subunit SRP54
MVLADLSAKLTTAIRSLGKQAVVDDEQIDACLKEVATALLQSDVNVKQVMSLRNSVRNSLKLTDAISSSGSAINKQKVVQKAVFDELVKLLSPSGGVAFRPKKGRSNVVMFVGLQGSGKTTSCVKYAYHFQRKGWKVALVCADTFRAGAFDQLRQNAAKIRVPFFGSHTETDPVKIAAEGVEVFKKEKYEIIIVDTSGRHRQETALFDEMKQVAAAVEPDETIFVMDSHIGQACYDQAHAFHSAVPVGSVIVTKLDGHAKGGGALSAVAATNAPIVFIGTGEHLDNLDRFEAKGFVSRMLGLGDIGGLVDTIKEAVSVEEQKEMMQRLQHGQFTLRDMYSQLQSVMKMGPLGNLMSMIPGLGANMPEGMEKHGVERMKKMIVIMDSLTDHELDSDKPITEMSRILRIARGAGVYPEQVIELIEEHKKFSKIVGRMGKAGLMNGNMGAMSRNPNQMINKLTSAIPQDMLNKLGGAGNLMNLMKNLEGDEGMQEMMKAMQGGKGGGKRGRR